MPFASRHIGLQPEDVERMLAVLGTSTLDQLIAETVPEDIRSRHHMKLPASRSESEIASALRGMAESNVVNTSMIGLGYSDCVTPAAIRRNLIENPAFYTGYTPYQPEISQGRLELLLRFQTMVADLTGMDIANASLLDEPTAVAEAVAMAHRLRRSGSKVLVSGDMHPANIAVLKTRAFGFRWEVETVDDLSQLHVGDEVFAVVMQTPGTLGGIHDVAAIRDALGDASALLIVATDLLACTLMQPPGECGADIVVGSAQRFGVPMFFGGPHAAFLATHTAHQRQMPGRLVGESKDAAGNRALRLALQAREQHIRRESATSNICTAQVLLANVAAAFAMWHGPAGLTEIARRTHAHAARLAAALVRGGFTVEHEQFFDTITVTGIDAKDVLERARSKGINLGQRGPDRVVIACDETTTDEILEQIATLLGCSVAPADSDEGSRIAIPRTTPFLQQGCFNDSHSETAFVRELRRLSDMDLALDRGMIPLGSCTMKLNAAVEMEGIGLPGFANLHPYVPSEQSLGYRTLISELEAWLCEITGYAAVSVQPNAGSQGELAGLLAIRSYHESRGESRRSVCLIPTSAHGTNAASAAMAGMAVVSVACDVAGNVDVDDLKRLLDLHRDDVSVLMATYPSTHGVFEAAIREICDMVHAVGGQVYLDGANLNALVGLARPGDFGGDVSHLNLHKTFCIPHGGGGPGVGPVAVAAHLAPFLPNHPARTDAGPSGGIGPISGAPFGSAGILPISWAYIALMGPDGLESATKHAILSANYIATRLDEAYPVLYRGERGRVAHECILDLRPLTQLTGVTVDDICKRLIDYGFHAPTMSFPVPGTLMIEPTESEPLSELDRFIEAMLNIRAEVLEIERGMVKVEDSALRHAPHTTEACLKDEWQAGYSRAEAATPTGAMTSSKYWPPVGRIDNAYGDRNLFCSCT
ncbi:MAG: aminomethyl-transferring glycine dehydrogenase [Acidimicrobiia bacterium]